MFWDPATSSDEQSNRFSLLRAIEWANWPLFLSQPIFPLLLLVYPLGKTALAIWGLNLIWAVVRYRFVSVRAAEVGALFVRVKWLTCPGAAIYLYLHDNTFSAVASVVWVLLAGFIGIPGKIGVVQVMMMRQLGYEPRA